MSKNFIMKSAVALALTASISAFAAEGINFDPDGAGATFGQSPVGVFQWSGANILARNCVPAPQAAADGCTVYIQSKLAAILSPTGSNVAFDSVGHEYTLVVRVAADSAFLNLTPAGALGSGMQFLDTNLVDALNNSTGAAGPDGKPDLFGDATSFFRIYYDDTLPAGSIPASDVTGLGYDDGTLIMSGSVGIEAFAVSVTNPLASTPLDSSTSTNGVNKNQAGVETLTTTGSARFVIDVKPGLDTIDPAFFKDPFVANATVLRIDIDDNGRGSSPFSAAEPSPSVGGFAPNYGKAVAGPFTRQNDFDCDGAGPATTCDLHLEGNPRSVFKHPFGVPEPASVGLLGLGLGLLGFGSKKLGRKRSA